jgi:hypothetical protein
VQELGRCMQNMLTADCQQLRSRCVMQWRTAAPHARWCARPDGHCHIICKEHAVRCRSKFRCTDRGRQTAQGADAPEHVSHRQHRINAPISPPAYVLPWRPPADVQGRQAAGRLSQLKTEAWATCCILCCACYQCQVVDDNRCTGHSYNTQSVYMWSRPGGSPNNPAPVQGTRPDRSGAAQRRPGGAGGSGAAVPARGSRGARAAVLRCAVQPVRRRKTCAN